ncbi:MAG: DUF1996 domain-containing protein [Solirubrobacterales bacterium]|jgi:hypothetical protein
MPRLRILAAAALGLALIGAATALAEPGDGVFTVPCELSHRLSDDPIVHPHHRGAAHSHEFYGNRSTNAHSRLASMRNGRTTCRRPEDRSGYWIPTLYKYGRPVAATSMTVYYRARGKAAASVEALPDGLQMIAGDAEAKEVQDNDFVDWSCANGMAFDDTVLGRGAAKVALRKARRRVRRLKRRRNAIRAGGRNGLKPVKRRLRRARSRLAEARLDVRPSSLPNCPPGARVHLSLNFPDCWDGRRLDSRDHKSHMAYAEWAAGERRCLPAHPVPVPAITFSISWPIGDGRGARFASGPVRTMHGDVFSAWDPGTQAFHVARCLKADVDCGSK